ncbi:MAG TPA: M48 family metallopeptidase [Burkholderiaceae bacterium]
MNRKLCVTLAIIGMVGQAQAVDLFKLGNVLKTVQTAQQIKDAVAPNSGGIAIPGANLLSGGAAPAAAPADAMQTLQQAKDATTDISEGDEVELGKGIAGNLLGAAPLLNDQSQQQYVNRVGRWVASQTERPELPWKFGVLDDDSINAFAVPGGYIFVTKGLMGKMKNEAELAGVLAHEIAHVVQKHHLNAIKANARGNLFKSVTGTLLQRSSSNADVGRVMISGGTELLSRGLDKNDEFEADRMGVVYATRAGYDPYGLPAVLQSLQAIKGDATGSMALLFKTHPQLGTRLDALDAAMSPLERYSDQPNLQTRFASVLGKN